MLPHEEMYGTPHVLVPDEIILGDPKTTRKVRLRATGSPLLNYEIFPPSPEAAAYSAARAAEAEYSQGTFDAMMEGQTQQQEAMGLSYKNTALESLQHYISRRTHKGAHRQPDQPGFVEAAYQTISTRARRQFGRIAAFGSGIRVRALNVFAPIHESEAYVGLDLFNERDTPMAAW